jgi:predicted negative regulator of RcsB-dependent stress response
MKQYFFLILFLSDCFSVSAKSHFTWSPKLKNAYKKVLALRFDEANFLIAQEKNQDSENLMVYHVENYLDFFRVYINEEDVEFNRLEGNKDRRLAKIKEGDENSPYYLYLQATTRLHWAMARLKFEEYATAAFEVNKAFKLLTKNVEKFPDFMPNKKELGILHAAVGTIPDNYRWMVEMLSSLEGTFEQGKQELEEVIAYAQRNDFIYEEEIYVLYSYLLLHLGNDAEASWKIINTGKLNTKNSLMGTFIVANIAMRTDRGDDAITILKNRPAGAAYHSFHYLDYMLGLAKLQRLDKDADVYLKKYVNRFGGKNFIKDAYQKLAWHALLFNNQAEYQRYNNLVKSKGTTVVGSDKSALKEAKAGEVPNTYLLKARLLFDGGHFQKAYDLLSTQCETDFKTKKTQLERSYRMGRITHKLQQDRYALDFYQTTIEEGKNEGWYFACRAALERGHIFEKQRKFSEAKAAYNLCLTIKPDEHKTGLHQQAKAGLSRLN